MNIGTKLSLECLPNTRDLGGMKTADGRMIRRGRLLRSGHLFFASRADLQWLKNAVDTVVDFRTEQERAEKPDPAIDGVTYRHLPAFTSLAAGVSRDAASNEAAFAMVSKDPALARRYMIRTYVGLVTDPFSLSQYGAFLHVLLAPHSKAVLWHCTAGKDRAGMASVITEELLGVPRADIMADYLKSNEYLRAEVQELHRIIFGGQEQAMDDATRQAADYLFGAHEAFLDAAYRSIDERFGSFERFAAEGLGLGAAQQEQLKALYLE